MNRHNQNLKDHYLELFVKLVDAGQTPPPEILRFVADGIRRYQKAGEPWPVSVGAPDKSTCWRPEATAPTVVDHQVVTPKPSKGYDGLQLGSMLLALEMAGLNRKRSAAVLGRSESAKTLKRRIDSVKALPKSRLPVMLELAIDQILRDHQIEEKAGDRILTGAEIERLKEILNTLKNQEIIDDREPV